MPATLQPSAPSLAKSRPAAPVRRQRMTLEELLRRATAAVERGPAKLVVGTFRPTKNGRPLTRAEKGLMMLMAGGLALAVWLHARPIPVSAHATLYQALAATTTLEASAPRTFAESALQAIGRDWRAETYFTCVSPAFWQQSPAIHPNARTARIEQGLARLAGHGALLAIMTFPDPTSVGTETIGGHERLASHVAGQLELADGTVVRFAARLVQDEDTKRWGLVELSIPGFLP
jgi:hypothetical protein